MMAELLDARIARLKAKLADLQRELPGDDRNTPVALTLEIQALENEIKYLSNIEPYLREHRWH